MKLLFVFLSFVYLVFSRAPGIPDGGGPPPIPGDLSQPPPIPGGGIGQGVQPNAPGGGIGGGARPNNDYDGGDYDDGTVNIGGNTGGGWGQGPQGPQGQGGIEQYTSTWYRGFNRQSDHHYLHPDRSLVQQKTGRPGGPMGRIITMDAYQQNRAQLSSLCPQLMELVNLEKNQAQFLGTERKEIEKRMKDGHNPSPSAGMCVDSRSQGACGANLPLLAAKRDRNKDYVYFVDPIEKEQYLKKHKKQWKDAGRGVICYVWQ